VFRGIEEDIPNKSQEKRKEHKFPMEWWEDEDCDSDKGWNKEWDDFDWDTSQEDDDEDLDGED
jgi:hypothetical protein